MSDGCHVSHCCDRHGCKYGDDDCPVANGRLKQEGPCYYCYKDWDGENYYGDGVCSVGIRPDTKSVVEKIMRLTGTRDPETVINGAVMFLLEGLGELERYENAEES